MLFIFPTRYFVFFKKNLKHRSLISFMVLWYYYYPLGYTHRYSHVGTRTLQIRKINICKSVK